MEEILEELKSAIKTEFPYMSCDGTLNIENREWNDALDFAIKKLESLKSHTDKVVIPNIVADLIEYYKSAGDSLGELLAHIEYDDVLKIKLEMLSKVVEWVYPDDFSNNEDRIDLIARAWLDGYEVEKEKRYFIKEPVTGQFLIRDDSQSRGVKWVGGFSTSPSYFTETEIKAIDERYWSFAEEVTE